MTGERTAEEIAADELALESKNIDDDKAQKLSSWLGRVEKSGKDNSDAMNTKIEALASSMQNLTDLFQTQSAPKAEPNAVNEKFRELLLGDNPQEAFQLHDQITSDAKRNLNAMKESKLNAAFEIVKDHPQMSDDVKAEAKTMVANGVDPNSAVQMAVLRAENKHKGGILTQIKEQNPIVLEMLGSGNPKPGVKPEGKLPASFETACQKAIADGVFKDRVEYIKFMDPKTKASLGLE